MELTAKDIEKMKNTPIYQVALQLEDGLINMGLLPEDMSLLEFVKHYLNE